MKDIIDIP